MVFSATPVSILLATIPTHAILPTGGKCTILKESVAYRGASSIKWGDTPAIVLGNKMKYVGNSFSRNCHRISYKESGDH